MTAALQALQDQYKLLSDSLPALLDACHGDAGQMDAINTQYAAAEANYTKCINDVFNDNDPGVQALVAQMKHNQATFAATVAHIGEIAGVITMITNAVQIGTALAAKV